MRDAVFLVYFAQMGKDGPIKIGRAGDVAGRLRQLQVHLPHPLVLLASHRGWKRGRAASTEKELHCRFAAARLRGEWFCPAPEILEYVALVGRDAAAVESSAHARVLATTRDAASDLLAWRGEHSLKTAGRLIGIDATTLGKIEAGKYIPGEAMRWRIVNTVGIPIDAWPPRPSKKERAA